MQSNWQKKGVGRLQVLRGSELADADRLARRSRLRAQHSRRRIERRDPGQPRLLGRQRGVRHGAGQGRRRARDADRQYPGLQQRARRPGRGPPLQLRRGLPAALGGARRRGGADSRQSRPAQDLHHHREDRGPRRARDPRDGPAERHRHLRRQRPGRGRLVEPGAHRRRAGRRQSGRFAAAGLDRDLLQFGRLLDHHRAVPAHGGLGHDDRHLQRQGSSTSTTRRRSSPSRWPTTRAARRRCCIASRAAITNSTPTSPSRWWPAWSAAGRASSRARSAMPARWRAATTTRRPRNAGSWRSSAWTRSSRPSSPCSPPRARW